MADERVSRLASLVVNWSLGIRKGDTVLIDSYKVALPLVDELDERARNRDARVIRDVDDEATEYALIQNGGEAQVRERYRQKTTSARQANKIILIECSALPELKEQIPNDKLKLVEELENPFYDRVWSPDVGSVIVHYPTEGHARQSGLSLQEYEDAVYRMMLINWEEESRKMAEIAKLFKGVRKVRVEGNDTDLQLRIDGNPTIEDGKENLPGGEIYFGDMKGASAQGIVYFDVPVFYDKRMEHVRLEFMYGKLTNVSAAVNDDYLQTLFLGRHRGFLEEIGFGTNPHASTRVYRWAEKAYGTMHLGVDNAHGTNIDFTKTMNPGRVVAYQRDGRSGRTILENARFVL